MLLDAAIDEELYFTVILSIERKSTKYSSSAKCSKIKHTSSITLMNTRQAGTASQVQPARYCAWVTVLALGTNADYNATLN